MGRMGYHHSWLVITNLCRVGQERRKESDIRYHPYTGGAGGSNFYKLQLVIANYDKSKKGGIL